MTDVDEEQDHLIRLLSPTVHCSTPADDQLLRDIMRTRVAPPWRRRLVVAVPVVAGLTAAALVVGSLLPASAPVGPIGPAPANAALTFAEDAGFLTVTIKDPAADPQRYRDELAKHGLNIKIELVPAGPEDVGKVVFVEVGDTGGGPTLEAIEDPGRCAANGSCEVGFKVPLNFTSYAVVAFGRTPLPGEFPDGGSAEQNADAAKLRGKRVAEARELLAAAGRTAEYRVGFQSLAATADQVPGSWIVYDTAPISSTVVVLWVSQDGTPPAPTGTDDSGAGATPSAAPSVKAG